MECATLMYSNPESFHLTPWRIFSRLFSAADVHLPPQLLHQLGPPP